MYTGIIDHMGSIVKIDDTEHCRHLVITNQFKQIKLGESIAVDGICLTATADSDGVLTCDLSPETLALTKAADYQVGDAVNMERSLAVGDRMGGHTVTGHVDGLASITACDMYGDCCHMTVEGFSPAQQRLVWHKGSITIDGISLTINALTPKGVELMLIPQTLALTTLSQKSVGDKVHVEFDPMAKIIARQFELMQAEPAVREKDYVD